MGGAPPWYGVMGAYVSGSSQPWHVSFRGIDPGGPADRAGIREGSSIDVREQSALVRLSLLGQPLAARPITFQVNDAGVMTQRVLVPEVFSLSRFWQYVVWEFASLWFLLFAVLIAWRRPYVDNNLLLATLLASTSVGISSALLLFAWPWPWPYVALSLIGQSEPISIALWATLASAFARPLSPLRRVALGACYGDRRDLDSLWKRNARPSAGPGAASRDANAVVRSDGLHRGALDYNEHYGGPRGGRMQRSRGVCKPRSGTTTRWMASRAVHVTLLCPGFGANWVFIS